MELPNILGTAGFILHVRAEVIYEGRANSTLECGDYVIIKKPDNSIQVIGRDLVQPRNYLTKAYLDVNNSTITAASKTETLTIIIHKIYHFYSVYPWSDNKIKLVKTEAELRDKIAFDPQRYLGVDPDLYLVEREYKLDVGAIDVALFPKDRNNPIPIHIVEVKRKTITLSAAYQLQRYADHLRYLSTAVIKLYLAAPAISAKAESYCATKGITYVYVDF